MNSINYDTKKEKLLTHIEALAKEDIMLAFSGGVDSSLLLKLCCQAAHKNGNKVYAVTVQTELHPTKDLEIAKRIVAECGAEHIVLFLDELEEAGIVFNPENRCYLCKKCLFQKLLAKAEEHGVKNVIEGTNEDDLHVYRPGIKALKELGIVSPLALAGMTKEEVRKMAAEYGSSVANRPSTPCMATRFPYGAELSYEIMRQVEEGEEWLRGQGFYNVRIRVHDKIARLEIDKNDMEKILLMGNEVVDHIKKYGFDYVTLDLEGFRSGSMDLHVYDK